MLWVKQELGKFGGIVQRQAMQAEVAVAQQLGLHLLQSACVPKDAPAQALVLALCLLSIRKFVSSCSRAGREYL